MEKILRLNSLLNQYQVSIKGKSLHIMLLIKKAIKVKIKNIIYK